MKKTIFAGILLAGLLLLALFAYIAAPAVVIVPPESTAVIVPQNSTAVILSAPVITPGVPHVIFIGVTTISPLDLAEHQGLFNNVVVTFDEAMDPVTVNGNTFMVKGPDNVNLEGIISHDATNKVWTFNPTDTLKLHSVYTIIVTTGAKGVSGNSLVENFVASFTTASGGGSNPSPAPGPSPPSPSVLTTITLTPTSANLTVGSIQQLSVTSLDQFGSPIAATINYVTSNSSVATVNASGAVTAVGAGNATITGASGAINDTSIIFVAAAPIAACPAVSVNLGTAGDFAILSGTGISTTGTTSITGDIGTGPAVTDTAITGFGLIMDALNQWSTSSLVNGKVYAYNYAVPTPDKMNTAIIDLGTAYTTADGLAACVTELGAGNIGGMTLAPGVYKWGTGVTIPTDVTINGSATDVWVFQIAQTLDIASAAQVKLTGGALAKNVFWVVTGTTTLGTTSVFNGNILSGPGTSTIALQNGATLNGRALGQKDVTLIANAVTISN